MEKGKESRGGGGGDVGERFCMGPLVPRFACHEGAKTRNKAKTLNNLLLGIVECVYCCTREEMVYGQAGAR